MKTIININKDWEFQKKEGDPIESVCIPHTWNAKDGQDGGNDYYRGVCIYTKELDEDLLSRKEDEEIYVEFHGVNLVATVFIDEKECCKHEGGYSAFRTRIDPYLDPSFTTHILKVYADNRAVRSVYPQKADFTFYGGIYRDVNLIKVDHSHFELDYFGTPALKITPQVDGKDATVEIEAFVSNTEGNKVVFSFFDENEQLVTLETTVKEGKACAEYRIENVHLWDGIKDPHLYEVRAQLVKNNETVDEVTQKFGCRTFYVDSEKGFFLNGHSYPLHGVSRHQDRKGLGNALTKEMQEEDIQTILSMGANSIRAAHYQHDPYFYELCDRYGIVVWAEIPYISEYMKEAEENAFQQMKELIVQNYNHPCIYCWALSNEITVSGVSEELIEHHKRLHAYVKQLDQTRYTSMANLFMLETDSPLLEVPDIFSYNLYYGWYVGEMKDNDAFFDKFHKQYPDTPIGLSEYGADALLNVQTNDPQKGDYSEQYQSLYHEHMLKMFSEKEYLWCTYVWNMFDFGADGRNEANEPGVNHKGLVAFDHKTKKDAFYIYKAYWSNEPFVHMCGRRYKDRVEDTTEIKVYSNQRSVSLYKDDELIETKEGKYIFTFHVSIEGKHTFKAVSGDLADQIVVEKVKQPNPDYVLKNTTVINWFDIEVKEGFYSIKDTLGDIQRSAQGKALIDAMMKQMAANMGDVAKNAQVTEQMQQMIARQPLESVLKMGGASVKKEMIIALNKQLNQIPKE